MSIPKNSSRPWVAIGLIMILAALYVNHKWPEWRKTPEERRRDEIAGYDAAEREVKAAAASSAHQTAEQDEFSRFLLANTDVLTTRWLNHELLWITLRPEKLTTPSNAEVIAKEIAFWWAGRAGLTYARVEVRKGSRNFATGTYQGAVPPVHALRQEVAAP